jgi:tetratricopeptide (TPR) repeat protein
VAKAGGGPLLAAARALILAGQWELADRLLASIQASDQAERAAVALARAQIAVELRQWRGTGDPAPAIGTAAAVIASSADTGAAFDLSLLRVFRDYWAELVPADGTPPHLGPEGRDPATLDELRDQAEHLTAAAPDSRRAARAAFYAGLIADNLRGEPGRAEELFIQALAACRPGPDDDVASEALRHLGGTAQATGDLPLARQRWERSAVLAQRAGWLPLALAQQALLAELAAEEGDRAGARTLAREVRRWATALGLSRLEHQAAAIDSGQ